MSTFAERKKAATSAESTVRLCLDLQLHDRRREAYAELARQHASERRASEEQVTVDAAPVSGSLDAQLDAAMEIDAAIEAKSEPYVLHKLRRHEWRELVEAHPATAKEKEQDESAAICEDTFWPAAIARCAHEPGLTVDDVLWLRDGDEEWSGLPPAEFNKLINALQELHSTGVQVPKELLHIATTLRRGRNGTTPVSEASPSRSSAAESRKRTKGTG